MDSVHDIPEVDPETESVGSMLRRSRESTTISLHDAAEATRISMKYLVALEEDRPEDLPSPAYLKGFVKTYAVCLGLQGEELDRLLALTMVPLPVETTPTARAASVFVRLNWQRLFLPSVLLGALIISAIFLSPPSSQRSVQPARQQPLAVAVAPLTALQPVVSSAVQPTGAPIPQLVGSAQSSETAATTSRPQNGVLVSMKVNRASTLSVIIDDGAAQGYELTSGDLIEWKASSTIALDISDAGSVEIELNNTPLKLKTPPGKQTYIVLDANGIRR